MKLSDELKEARRAIEAAMYEQMQRDNARCAGAGKRIGLKPPKRGVANAPATP